MSKKQLKHAHSTLVGGFNPVSGAPISHGSGGGDDSEMILTYEKRISELMMTLQKQERDILYKDEEIKSIKNIARDVAEELEPAKVREQELKFLLTQRDDSLEQSRTREQELTKQIQDLKAQLADESRVTNKMVDMRLDFEAKIDKNQVEIHRLKEDVAKYRDEVKGKDEAIKALALTLLEKGKDNQKLQELVVQIKNH